MGASLSAMTKLGLEKGYSLVGCDIIGANAFFVRANSRKAISLSLSQPRITISRRDIISPMASSPDILRNAQPNNRGYSTVTDFARLRGWSASLPMTTAV